MKKMRILLKLILYTLTGCVSSLSVTGCRGRTVAISCTYNEDGKNEYKYFCTGHSLSARCDKLIISNRSNIWEHNGRFSLYDSPENNEFIVIIRELSDADQRTKYWCGVNVPKFYKSDIYTEVKLKVLEGDRCSSSVSKAAYLGGSVTISCKYPMSEDDNVRYFCKENKRFTCDSVISGRPGSHTQRDRFTLSETRGEGVYTVTISSLTEDDAGKYWCAMKRTHPSFISQLTEVHLRVVNWDDIKSKEEIASAGENVHLYCEYPESHEENEKFLCKGENPFSCEVLINTTQQRVRESEGRLSMMDFGRLKYFRVNIKDVSLNDAGTYWCGSDRTWQPASYTRIHLSVGKKPIKTKTTTTTASASASSSAAVSSPAASASTPGTSTSVRSSLIITSNSSQNGTSVYITVSVSLALLLIVVSLVIIYRHKINRTHGPRPPQHITSTENHTEAAHGDQDYEDIDERFHQAASESAVHSVYTTVSLPPHASDLLHYATVSFHKRPSCAGKASVSISAQTNPIPATAETDCSTCEHSPVRGIQRPSTTEEALYATPRNVREL